MLKASADEAPHQLLVQAKESRAFEWLLSPKMRVDLQKRVQELIRKCMTVHLVPIKDGDDRKGKSSKQLNADCEKSKHASMVVFSDGPSASASSSSGKKIVLDKTEKKDKMWRLFCGRPKSGASTK